VFANGDADIWGFGTSIIHLVHGTTPRDVPVTKASLSRFTGTYEATGVLAVVRVEADHLKARVTGTNSATFNFEPRLLNQGNGTFLVGWEPGSSLVFDTSNAPAASVVLNHGGRALTLQRRP
jgi:hypothetical protein